MIQTLTSTSGSAIPEAAVERFAQSHRGRVLRPGDPGYDDARRVFNGMIDHRPGLIAQPLDAQDVQHCVKFAREHDLLVSIKGGGHSVQGYSVCDDGLMIDLVALKAITVDPRARTATAGGGVNWGEFDAATQEHGLAIPGGRMPTTGIAGLTLGSGSGWLERKLGYTVDSMIGAEVVLANGEAVHASENENADLFWALRGGGGNFGIVTRFEYRLHPIGPIVYGGMLGFPRHPSFLRAYRDFLEGAPDDVGGAAALITAPPEPFVPAAVQGQPVMGVIVCYTGKPEEGERAMKPLLDLNPVLRMVAPIPYVAVQQLLVPANPPGMQQYWKAEMYPALPDEAIDVLIEKATPPLSPLTTIIVQPLGGQVHRVPDDATAMGWRASANWALHILGAWEDPAQNDAQIAWVRSVADAMHPWAQKGTYLNYLMDEGEQRVKDSFGAHYARLVELKNRYDPTNFFRLNQNIKPSV
ncbi:MAG TPA: FAD-binding oxidoreductase [Dehalococcoidia bacterium]|nr:FAD-binding oxidoreductase [Dehalococcoidia bacterium]